MQHDSRNPQIASLLYIVTLVELGVLLLATLGLFFLPEIARPIWPWEIAPFNTRFMGAVYSGSAIAAALMVISKRWSPARVVTLLIFAFTLLILLVSLFYLDQFHLSLWSTWIWFFLYIALPLNAAYHLWKYRNLPPAEVMPLSALWRGVMFAVGGALLLYTLALLIVPTAATSFWPWEIDAFHARMYAAMFLVIGLGAVIIGRGASAQEMRAVGLGKIFFAVFSVAGLILVDSQVHRVVWNAAETWVWLVMFGLILAAGVLELVLAGRKQ